MKSFVVSTLIAGCLLAPAAMAGHPAGNAASAHRGQIGPFAISNGDSGYQRPISRKAQALLRLRNEALRMQRADGGTLSKTSYDYLQGKLDTINTGHY